MHITRRAFLGNSGAFLLGGMLASRDSLAFASPIPPLAPKPLPPLVIGPSDLEANGGLLLHMAVDGRMMNIRHVHSTVAALEQVSGRGFAIACCEARELIAAVTQGLPLVSVAQLSSRPFKTVAVPADGKITSVSALRRAPLLVSAMSDRKYWLEIGVASDLNAKELIHLNKPWYRALASGEASAALLDPIEVAESEGYNYPFRFLTPLGHDAHPGLCVVAHRDCLSNTAHYRAVASLLQTVTSACQEFDQIAAARLLFDRQLSRHACGEHVARVFVEKTLSFSMPTGVFGRFGRHDPVGWQAIRASISRADSSVRKIKLAQLFTDRFFSIALM